jgi:hypothetical protein
MAEQVPSVGRVVHVVTHEGHHRPAHILDPQDGQTICVLAFTKPQDAIRPGVSGGAVLWFIDDCEYDPAGLTPGSWHWPEFVPSKP